MGFFRPDYGRRYEHEKLQEFLEAVVKKYGIALYELLSLSLNGIISSKLSKQDFISFVHCEDQADPINGIGILYSYVAPLKQKILSLREVYVKMINDEIDNSQSTDEQKTTLKINTIKNLDAKYFEVFEIAVRAVLNAKLKVNKRLTGNEIQWVTEEERKQYYKVELERDLAAQREKDEEAERRTSLEIKPGTRHNTARSGVGFSDKDFYKWMRKTSKTMGKQ